jgi:hypothetical protein
MPTGGTVDGPVEDLLAGRPATLTLGCRLRVEPGQVVISELPLGVPTDLVTGQIASRASSHRWDASGVATPVEPAAPVGDLRDLSDRDHGIRVVCRLAADADPQDAITWLRAVWPVTVQVECVLPAPIGDLLAGWDRGDGSGLAALAALLPS